MDSKAYWANRAALDMVNRMESAEKTADRMSKASAAAEKALEKEMKAALRGVQSFGISEHEARTILNAAHDKSALLRLRAAANRVADDEHRKALLDAIDSAGAYRWRIGRLETLNKEINEQCTQLYKAQNRAITDCLKNVAKDSYYHSIFNVQQETGLAFSFAQIPEKTIDRILHYNWSGQSYSQRIWRDTNRLADQLKDELLVSMLSGRSGDKTARAISERFEANMYCARRLVRTESAYVANAATKESYSEAGISKYRFVAVLDNRTSELCAALDGKVFELEKAVAGTNYPPMHPFCRSTTIAVFGDDELKGMERRAKDENGNTVRVPADMSYREWYQKYVEKKTLDKSVKNDIMKVGNNQPVSVGGIQCRVYDDLFVFGSGGSNNSSSPKTAVIYETADGTKFVFPKKYDATKQSMTPEQAITLYKRVPKKLRELGQKTIEFVDYYNPQDTYWRKVYKNFSHSYATGGKDRITFYRYFGHQEDYVVRTYCHEIAHKIDADFSANGLNLSQSFEWISAMNSDLISSGMKSPTTYGKNSNVEDFAESIAEYVANPTEFKQHFPERAKIIENLLS